MNSSLNAIAAATLAARKRTGDNRISSNVKNGRFNLVLVTYGKRGNSTTETLRRGLTEAELIAALEAL